VIVISLTSILTIEQLNTRDGEMTRNNSVTRNNEMTRINLIPVYLSLSSGCGGGKEGAREFRLSDVIENS